MPRVDDFLLNRSTPFTLEPAVEKRTDLTLTQSATAAGRGRGTVTNSSDGSPIAGATVKVLTQKGDPVAHTTTNPSGSYLIDDLAAGTYTINVVMRGFVIPPGSSFAIHGNQLVNIDFGLTPDSRPMNVIFGVITNQVTGVPISGARVGLAPPDPSQTNTVVLTNIDGEYLIAEIPDGDYNLLAGQNGFLSSTLVPVTMSGGQILRVDLSLTPVAVPQATVNGFIKKQDGTPIAGACVGLYALDAKGVETLLQVTFSDSRGFYLFGRVEPGTYVVKAKSEKVAESFKSERVVESSTTDFRACEG